MKPSLSPSKILFSAILLALVIGLHLRIGELILTGDEPRYLFAAVSLWLKGDLRLPAAAYHDWLAAHAVRNLEASSGMHSVLHTAVLTPFVGEFGLAGGRWAQAAIGLLASILFIWTQRPAQQWSVAAFTAIFLLSLPVLPYLRLLYSEIWLYALLALTLALFARPRLSRAGIYLCYAMILLMPFIHLRSAIVAFGLGVYLLLRTWRDSERRGLDVATLIGTALIALAVFVWYQFHIAGGVSASAPFYPSFSTLIDRIAVQFFGYRHGLLLYNPIAILGMAGLLLGAVKRDELCTLGFALFAVYVLSFIWGAASESYTGRFWVFVAPILIIGAAYWWRQTSTRWKWAIAAPLFVITAVNAAYFVVDSGDFLANRFGSLTYDTLFYHIGERVHVGLIAASDPFDLNKILGDSHSLNIAVTLIVFGFSGAMALLALVPRRIALIVAGLILMGYGGVVAAATLKQIPANQTNVHRGIDELGRPFVSVELHNVGRVKGVKIGKYDDQPLWGVGDRFPKKFIVTGVRGDGVPVPAAPAPGIQFFRIDQPHKLRVLTITADDKLATPDWTSLDIRLF